MHKWPSVARKPEETLKEYDKRRWKERRRYQRREKSAGARICAFCQILLSSKYVGMKSVKYCDECRSDPEVRRHLRNLYMRRYHQKKAGIDQDSLNLLDAENT